MGVSQNVAPFVKKLNCFGIMPFKKTLFFFTYSIYSKDDNHLVYSCNNKQTFFNISTAIVYCNVKRCMLFKFPAIYVRMVSVKYNIVSSPPEGFPNV